jgi:hypothetical protein
MATVKRRFELEIERCCKMHLEIKVSKGSF